MSDIDTAVEVDSLKALDPEWPIREASNIDCINLCSCTVDGASTEAGFAVLFQMVEIWRAGQNKTANTYVIEIAT